MPVPIRTKQVFLTLLAAGGLTLGAFAISGNLTPDADNSRNVGSQSLRLANVFAVNSRSAFVSSTTMKIGDTGTILDGDYMVTTTINVASMGPQMGTSSLVTVTGAALGDFCHVNMTVGDYRSTTSTGYTSCVVLAVNTATIFFNNFATTTFDAGSSIFRVDVKSPATP